VDITYPHVPGDINLSNNDAQNNFFDVSTGTAPISPIHFLVGNPFARPVRLNVVPEKLPEELKPLIREPILEMPAVRPLAAEEERAIAPRNENEGEELMKGAISLKENELHVATITLERPPASVTEHLTHDLVVNVNTVVDGKIVGGFSVLVARANARPPAQIASGQTSKEAARPVTPPEATPIQKFELVVPLEPTSAHQSVLEYLASRSVRVTQNDPKNGLISSSAIPLSHEALLESITPNAQKLVSPNATGRYFVSFKTAREGTGAGAATHVVVSTRILVNTSQDLDSPLGGRVVASSGVIEKNYINALTTRLKLK